jgi:phospholipase/carboxylesterase
VSLLQTVERNTGPEPQAAVVWLHGLGADGHDFEPIVPELRLADGPDLRFVFPHAPVRPVTINMGMQMRAWYDIMNFDSGPPRDLPGIEASAAAVRALIEREVERGIPSERIVLAGFSQGGAIAMYTGLRYEQRLAGIMGLSTYLILSEPLADDRSDANASTPILVAHGTQDPVVPYPAGERSVARLTELGYPVEWHSYPMPHAVCPEEIADIRRWLGRCLPAG